MSPPYLFQINEIQQTADAPYQVNHHGTWIPSTDEGSHEVIGGGVSGRLWYCDRQRIYQVPQLPPQARHYKTFSVYYVAGWGFWVLRGNATNPPADENWHPLRFDHSPQDYSSYLTNAGDQARLRTQRSDQRWPSLLLPDIYHAPFQSQSQQHGGLTGELPIFLALMAFSTSREWLLTIFPHIFSSGIWRLHPNFQQPRTDQRGVVVTVWTCPSTYAGGSTSEDLEQYEEGNYGKYFN